MIRKGQERGDCSDYLTGTTEVVLTATCSGRELHFSVDTLALLASGGWDDAEAVHAFIYQTQGPEVDGRTAVVELISLLILDGHALCGEHRHAY